VSNDDAVFVIGTGAIPFGRHYEKTVAALAAPAILAALADAGAERKDVEAAYCGTALGGMMTGQRCLKPIGMTGIPTVNVENACASSATAFRQAWAGIRAGLHEVALVFGVEKLTKLSGPLPIESDDWEGAQGMTMPALYAMRARRYMHDRGATAADLAEVAVKARRHGALNEIAQMREPTTVEEVLSSRPVADPLTLLQCCPTGDGAAALVLASAAAARRFAGPGAARPARVISSTLVSGRYITGFRDMTSPEITKRAARIAYDDAGLGPEDIDVVETHDAFTVAELLYYEALGLSKEGEAVALLKSGASSVGGRIPVNPGGGLLARGHPVGASGAAQLVEITRQLQGRAGRRQVEGARVGLAHVTGGGISGLDHGTAAIHLLRV
jgi:benzoylsuccinyl-CoA thiolase BbsB subunit